MATYEQDDAEDRRLTQLAAAGQLSVAELKAWNDCRFTYRTFAHYNKLFAIWQVVDAQVVVIGSMRVLGPNVTTSEGFKLEALVKVGYEERFITLSHTPTAVYQDKIFAAVPHMFTAKFSPRGHSGNYVLQTPLVIRTQAKPWDAVYGVRMTQLSEFRAKYPQFKETRI